MLFLHRDGSVSTFWQLTPFDLVVPNTEPAAGAGRLTGGRAAMGHGRRQGPRQSLGKCLSRPKQALQNCRFLGEN
jgi:hypothetical protein